MVIAGIFIISSYESTNLLKTEKKLDDISEIVLGKLEQSDNIVGTNEEMTNFILNLEDIGLDTEIFIFNMNNELVNTSSQFSSQSIVHYLDVELMIEGLKISDGKISKINSEDMTFDKVYPISLNGKKEGYIYLRSDLSDFYLSVEENKLIIVRATILASIITMVLGFVIASNITEPIKDVTLKAEKMASGDFNQRVEIKSEDEIGQLASMFNFLTSKLNESMTQIYADKSKIEAIVNQMEDGLLATELNGKIIQINKSAKEIIDYNDEMNIFEFLNTYGMKINNDENQFKKLEFIKFDRLYRIKVVPFRDQKLYTIGLIFILKDITDENILENMRREFVANVSHELKTPLTAIKSYTESILSGVVDDPKTTRKFLEIVEGEADRMTRLVRDLLDLSNFDSKKITLEFEYNDYTRLIKNVCSKMHVIKKEKQILSSEVDDRLIGYFDYDRLEQVITNVVSNAIKYSFEDSVIKISCYSDKDNAIINIIDNGPGISYKDQERLFERFYRVDKARSRELGGTGLGLSIAKEIVNLHDGDIKINSSFGEGTKVTLTIPLNLIEEV
jgi:two-component system sensor histidine kinase VicK